MLELVNIFAGYGGGDVLKGVDLVVERGSLTCIVGPNGAGKSTLMKILAGVYKPDGGSMRFAGNDITGKVAQFGRGVMADVSSKLLGQFAEDLQRDVLSGVPADEAREPSERRGLEARPRRPCPRQLEELDRRVAALGVAAGAVADAGIASVQGVSQARVVDSRHDGKRGYRPVRVC